MLTAYEHAVRLELRGTEWLSVLARWSQRLGAELVSAIKRKVTTCNYDRFRYSTMLMNQRKRQEHVYVNVAETYRAGVEGLLRAGL